MLRLAVVVLAAGALAPATADAAGLELVSRWGSFTDAYKLALGPTGHVYVGEAGNPRVQEFLPDGTLVRQYGSGAGSGPGQLNGARGVAVDPAGNLYVADRENARIQVFGPDGTFLRQWGGLGAAPGQFNAPEGVAVDPAGNVYTVESFGARVQKFTSTGTPLAQWGTQGPANGQFQFPFDIAADDSGVYVADRDNGRVQKFDSNGQFLWAHGGLSRPVGVGVGVGDGNVYIAETNANNFRVQVLRTDGTLVEQQTNTAGIPSGQDVVQDAGGFIYVDPGTFVARFRRAIPQPVLAKRVTAELVSGRVLIRRPGAKRFARLTAASSIPVRSLVDTRKGMVRITSAKDGAGATQASDFYQGTFQVLQAKSGLTDAVLTGGRFPKGCGKAARSPVVRKLWARGKGRFRTRGRYASAVVRGTRWLTADRCDGTLVQVAEGVSGSSGIWIS